MKRLLLGLLFCRLCLPQDLSEAEQKALSQGLGEAGSSPIEMIRAMENHLAKFPESPKRAEIERLLAKGAMETRDDRRPILYGERELAPEQDDLQIPDR